ncbi:Uncharacterised protein [Peptoniphilus harei]|uniref:SHIRT domain-containing protein n=1 Tax=Peptoniphilus harei TaxID=54005 RepID=A0A2X1XCA1_9FIRM|nr:SHIRT domain-containing protein [Peptoniphilus harei]SPY38523.1 Uncharacterised protein [Peptoniphilus harei]
MEKLKRRPTRNLRIQTSRTKTIQVDYEFQPSKAEGTPSELPQGVKDQLPKTVENLADGKSVPSPKEFTPVKDEVNKGTWTFEAWIKKLQKSMEQTNT